VTLAARAPRPSPPDLPRFLTTAGPGYLPFRSV
jgi:hypothetical protein